MSTTPQSMPTAALARRIQMLRTAMGPLIAAALEDPDVVEIMLNPDRTLWVDRLSSGRAPMGVEMPEADGERIIRLVAAHVGAEVHRGQPLLSAELPETGERFEGILPPAAPGPAFALRKRAIGVIPLERHVVEGMMTAAQAGFLVRAVRERKNILIAGATSSGKTTLANALLAEIAATGDRVLVLEDTVELQCAARDHVPLRTRAGVVSMTELVRSSMRLRPDRVVVGEVRGAEALDLIKVWGTGHPGGIATIHAGSALGALLRLEQLILEVAVNPPRALIAEAALADGNAVIAAGRNVDAIAKRLGESPALLPVALDVTDEAQAKAAVAAGLARFGRIDVLVNNAGFGLLGAVEESSDADVRRMYDTNVFGLLNVTRAVLPTLRAQRAGHVINLSSLGGYRSGAGFGAYCSTNRWASTRPSSNPAISAPISWTRRR
ncbi:hypothetical protein G6F68_010475 [Rhizopus microsporus]|nr:hypothetical protein G6F68_010475 [Rhizopus microsporus]